MSDSLEARIAAALTIADEASACGAAYAFLPEIKELLKAMLSDAKISPVERKQLSGALGRLVTEDFAFAESALGTVLLEVADAFAVSARNHRS